MKPDFYRDPNTGQVWEYTEKLAKVAGQRGLVPHELQATTIEETEVDKLTKVQLSVQVGHLAKILNKKVKLDMRKSVTTLRKEVAILRDEARVVKESK